ncbi:MAG: 2-oxoglutarate dehydrogenase complex dihydrolipoyllysine-residue succinyltransferase [Chloroflexi bacterium]|nr:2-oxoglutarate dehydrogenase complex dihydrolipoyllysine-residue succinyltransferase [Chloroflexota bacterium]
MSIKIVVPELGESVVEATVGRWLKKEGDHVDAGETIVELETDKVDLEVGAERAGVLARIEKKEGEDVKVGEVLGMIEDAPEKVAAAPSKPTPPPSIPEEAAHVAPPADGDKVTPVARRFAREKGIDLAQVAGTGPGGRVTKQDVEASLTPLPPSPGTELRSRRGGKGLGEGGEERVRMSRRRRTIAQRLLEATQTTAMLTTFNEIDMSAVVEMRRRRRDTFKERYGVGLGFMSFFVKASIGALKAFPQLNAEIQGDEIVLKHYYDIGIAVGAKGGLVVPVLRDADRLSFAEIEKAIGELAQKAEEGTLSVEDLRGGTFTITNGGVFGSLLSTPILNLPQVGILGLHKVEERPIALNGQVVIRPMMYVAVSYDHRIVDGREAVQFLVRIKQLVEDPEALLLEG